MDTFIVTFLLLFDSYISLCASTQVVPGLGTQSSSFGIARSASYTNTTMVTSVASRPQSCGACVVGGPNVDVYYWPEPNVNTSCLSIIGTALSPPLAGATISNGATYWGYSDEEGYLTTMIYTSINGITFKLPIWDPWPYTETGKLPIGYTYTLMEPLGKRSHETQVRGPIEPRAPFNESQGLLLGNDSFSAGNRMFIESTVVHNGHTL